MDNIGFHPLSRPFSDGDRQMEPGRHRRSMPFVMTTVNCLKCRAQISPTIWDLIPNGLGYVYVSCRSCGKSNQVRWVPSLVLWLVSLALVLPLAIPLFSSELPTALGVTAITLLLFLTFRVLMLEFFRRSPHPFAGSKTGRK